MLRMGLVGLIGGGAERVRERAQALESRVSALSRSQAVIEFDTAGRVVEVNDNFLSALGYARAEVMGQHHRMFMPPGEAEARGYADFWAALARGEFKAGRFCRLGKGGRRVWIQASYNPIHDDKGRVIGVIKFASDITSEVVSAVENAGQLSAIDRVMAVIEFDL
jgi:methyl-accepting chemotaxis protein